MEFLDNLVLPQSAEHIELLHYMLTLIQILFITFISVVFGGLFLSLRFRKKGFKFSNSTFLSYARDIIEFTTVNNSVGIILGLVPLFTAILIYAQLLHTSETSVVLMLSYSFLFILVGLIMTYIYRHSFTLSRVFSGINSSGISDTSTAGDIEKLTSSTSNLAVKNGRYAVIFLFIGIWFFTAAVTSAVNFKALNSTEILPLLFSPRVLLNLLVFILFSFTLTGSAVLFGFLYWKEDKPLPDEYKNFIKSNASGFALYSAVPLPFLLMLNIFLLPENYLSGTVFFYSISGLILLFLAFHLLYMIRQYDKKLYSASLFLVVIFAVLSLVIKDQMAMTNATASHSVVLSSQFDQMLAELKGTGAIEEISGKELYEVRCASCHQFDQKLVGPPHNEVLPKYENNEAQLTAFIRNPVKVDPEYPPMPNPGLKPNEAQAVAKYLLETYKERGN